MDYKIPHKCPVCEHELKVTKLACTYCSTKIEGEFSSCKFCKLPLEQLVFIEAFIKCRGNIKEVEKELGISYPTVRSRLDNVIEALGYAAEREKGFIMETTDQAEAQRERQEILDALDRGEITAQEAALQIRKRTQDD